MLKKALVIFAKVPITGLVKTRLSAAFDPENATQLYRGFLLDTIDLALGVGECETIIAYSPRGASQVLRGLVKKPIGIMPQSEGDLGARMNNVFTKLFTLGYRSVVMIGADSPTLPLDYLKEAFSALEQNTAVLGPSLDGGFYLVGLNSRQPEIFKKINWGSCQVFRQTVERIDRRRLPWKCLNAWYDVDTFDDLNNLICHLKALVSTGETALPRNTLRALCGLGLLQMSQNA